MRTNDEAWANAMTISKRIAAAAGDEPKNDVLMALALLVTYTLKSETTSLPESIRDLEKFRGLVENSLTELWGH